MDLLSRNLEPRRHYGYLRSALVLNVEDQETIDNSHLPRSQRAIKLIDIIRTKGPTAFDALCRSLEQDKTQVFLLAELNKSLEREIGNSPPLFHLKLFTDLVKASQNLKANTSTLKATISTLKASTSTLKANTSTLKANTWIFEGKAIGTEAEVFNIRPEQKWYAHVWQDRYSTELNFDCFCLDIHLVLITYKLLLIYYYNF